MYEWKGSFVVDLKDWPYSTDFNFLKNWGFTEWCITVHTSSLIKWGSLSSYKCWNWSIVGNDTFQSVEETVYWMIDFVSQDCHLYNLFRKRFNQRKFEWFEWLWSDAKSEKEKWEKCQQLCKWLLIGKWH